MCTVEAVELLLIIYGVSSHVSSLLVNTLTPFLFALSIFKSILKRNTLKGISFNSFFLRRSNLTMSSNFFPCIFHEMIQDDNSLATLLLKAFSNGTSYCTCETVTNK